MRDHVAFLRGIANVPMLPFRDKLEGLGLTDVDSFGGTGNLIFSADEGDRVRLEESIAKAVGTAAFVRTRAQLSRIVASDPHKGRDGAAVFLAKRDIGVKRARSLLAEGFQGEPPVVRGSTVYFVHPTNRPGLKTVVDFERELGIAGTMRSSRVLARVLDKMNEDQGGGRQR